VREAKLIPADAVRVEAEAPVVVDRAPPEVKEWGRWRMPKLSWMPEGDLALTFQLGRDHYCDQGLPAPLFRSSDQGRTWRRAEWPSPRFAGHPVISRVHDGDYWCLPSGTGIELDPARIPKPFVTWNEGGCAFPIYRLGEFPAEVRDWFRDLVALRWSPATKRWSEEQVRWDHRDQCTFTYDDKPQKIPGVWSQKVYFETPAVRLGNELVHVDYWSLWEPTPGQAPQGWDSWLMVSSDNGRSWTRRSRLSAPTGGRMDCEPILERTLDDGLVGVMRVEPGHPMLLVRSRDRGHTWTQPENLLGYGVFPWLQQLENGVLVLTYGRAPGTWMTFSLDGGVSWTKPHALLDEDAQTLKEHGSSDGYTSMVALDRDSFLVSYGDRNLKDDRGERRKSILTRRIRVTPR
jgi:hypothetical protein